MLDFLANFFLEMTTDLLRAHLNDGSVRSTKMEGSLLDMVDNRFNRPRSVCCVFERFDLRRYSLRSWKYQKRMTANVEYQFGLTKMKHEEFKMDWQSRSASSFPRLVLSGSTDTVSPLWAHSTSVHDCAHESGVSYNSLCAGPLVERFSSCRIHINIHIEEREIFNKDESHRACTMSKPLTSSNIVARITKQTDRPSSPSPYPRQRRGQNPILHRPDPVFSTRLVTKK